MQQSPSPTSAFNDPSFVADATDVPSFKGWMPEAVEEAEYREVASYVRRILAGEVLTHRIRLDIARICNFKCPFCFASLGKVAAAQIEQQIVPLEMIRECIPQFVRLGVRIVNLYGGGEPTLHPQAPKILGLLAEAGMKMRIITNGSGLNETLQQAIIKHAAQIDSVRFSIPGVSAESYRQITGMPLFEPITASIAAFARRIKTAPMFRKSGSTFR